MVRVADQGFQSTGGAPGAGGAGGIAHAAAQPNIATTRMPTAAPPVDSSPPSTWPSRIETKVPPSIRPVPSSSSSGARYCGSAAYLIGLKKVECTPSRKTMPSSSGIEP